MNQAQQVDVEALAQAAQQMVVPVFWAAIAAAALVPVAAAVGTVAATAVEKRFKK